MSLPLEARALLDIERVVATHKKPLVLFSGGKDSLVLAHLVRRLGIACDVFTEISVNFPEDEADIRTGAAKLGLAPIYHVELTYTRLAEVQRHLLPPCDYHYHVLDARRHRAAIDRFLRRNPAYDLAVFGRRHQENTVPSIYYQRRGCRWHSFHPLIDWRSEDVWAYIREHRIWYPRVYDTGATQMRTWVSFLNAAYAENRETFIEKLHQRHPEAVENLANFYQPAREFMNHAH